jgi:ribosomal biogenesis protein LAS1
LGIRGFVLTFHSRFGESLNETFREWDPVLQRVAESHPSFLRYLVEDMVNDLAFNDPEDAADSPQAEAMYLWLSHILTHSFWEFHRQSCPQSYVLQACDESPHHFTKLLSRHLNKQAELAKKASGPRSATKNRVLKSKSTSNGSVGAAQLSEKLLQHGWGFVEKWDSRPLGVVSSN